MRAGTTFRTSLGRSWLGIGYLIADAGGLVLVITLIIGGIGVRRLQAGKGDGLLKATLVLSVVLLAAYVVAVWAMAGKPGARSARRLAGRGERNTPRLVLLGEAHEQRVQLGPLLGAQRVEELVLVAARERPQAP